MSTDPWVDPNKPPPSVAITLCTSDYRGDHAADVAVAIRAEPDETVATLVARSGLTNIHDHLEIRLVRPDDGNAEPF